MTRRSLIDISSTDLASIKSQGNTADRTMYATSNRRIMSDREERRSTNTLTERKQQKDEGGKVSSAV